MEANGKYNTRNPAVKRILQEMKELQCDPSKEFLASALESNIFEWLFVIRGPKDTPYEGGIYHGRILLPPEYPFKPPAFVMHTVSGRWEPGVKICLSISSHHPEHWQPSWSIRTALVALISFMPSPANGAIGSLEYSAEERQKWAQQSREGPPLFGSNERRHLMAEMHAAALAIADDESAAPSPQPDAPAPAVVAVPVAQTSPAQQDTALALVKEPLAETASAVQVPAGNKAATGPPACQHSEEQQQAAARGAGGSSSLEQRPQAALMDTQMFLQAAVPTATAAGVPAPSRAQRRLWLGRDSAAWEELGLTVLAGALGVAIAGILLRRVVHAVLIPDFMSGF